MYPLLSLIVLLMSLFKYTLIQACDPSCICEDLSTPSVCTKCLNLNYAFIEDDNSKCVLENEIDKKVFYLDESDKKFKKCPCDQCENTDPDLTKCAKCAPGFFTLEASADIFQCVTVAPVTGYFLENGIYYKCFILCATCQVRGNEQNSTCDTCAPHYGSIEDQPGQCILDSSDFMGYYYSDPDRQFKRCYEKCQICHQSGVSDDQHCKSCKSNNFLVEKNGLSQSKGPNGNCVETKPISEGKFIEDISLFNPEPNFDFKESIIKAGLFIYAIYSYQKQSDLHKYIPHFDFTPAFSTMKTLYGIQSLDDLIVAQSLKNSSNITTTKSTIALYLKDGTKLDTSQLIPSNASFNAVFPIHVNESSVSLVYAQELADKDIDLYDIKDKFYYSLCSPFAKDGKDLSLLDKRYALFPNVTLCQPGCLYQGVIFSNYSFECQCFFNDTIQQVNSFPSENEGNNNFLLFKCYSLYSQIKFSDAMSIIAIVLMSLEIGMTVFVVLTYRKGIDQHLKKMINNPPRKTTESQPTEQKEQNHNSFDCDNLEEDNNENGEEHKDEIHDISNIISEIKDNTNNDGSMIESSFNSNLNKVEAKVVLISSHTLPSQQEKDSPERGNEENNNEVQIEEKPPSNKSNSNQNNTILKIEDDYQSNHVFDELIEEKSEKPNVELIQYELEFSRNIHKDNEDEDLKSSERQLDFKSSPSVLKSSIKPKKGMKINHHNTQIDSMSMNMQKDNSSINEGASFASSIGFEAQWNHLSFDEYNISPLNAVLHLWKAKQFSYWKHFCYTFHEKQIAFVLFNRKNMFYPLSLRLFVFIYNIVSIIFFNALLYTPDYITQRSKETAVLDFVYILTTEWAKCFYAALIIILTAKVYYLLTYCNVIFSRINEKDKEKNSKLIFDLLFNFRIRVIALLIVLFILMIVYFYFILLFCALYPNNVIALIHSSIISFLLYIPIQVVLCTLVSFTRFVGIDNELK